MPDTTLLAQIGGGVLFLATVAGTFAGAYRKARGPTTARSKADMGPTRPRPSVLLVDDEPGVIEIIRGMLAALPVHVDVARTLAEARELTRRHVYLVALIDPGLGGEDGTKVVAMLRTHAVLYSSGHPDDLYRACEVCGADEVIGKSTPLREVVAMVRRRLSERAA